MKKIHITLLVFFVVGLFPVFAWAQVGENYVVEIEGRYWNPKLDASVKIVKNDVGTHFSAVDDLGFDEKKDSGEARIQIKFAKKHKFNLSFLPLKWDADKVLTSTIIFSGTTYTAGTRVQSKLDLNVFKAGYEYDFLEGSWGFLGGTIDVMAADMNVELKTPALAINEKESKTVPIPLIGLTARIYPVKWVNFTAKVSGLPMGSYGHVFDAEVSLNINPIKYVGISGGYRYFETKFKYDNNSLDFKLDGPFLALKIRF